MFKACIGFRSRRLDYLDRTHCNLVKIPDEVYRNERWLEELIMDMNMLQELPPRLFRLVNLRRLSVSENDLLRLPPGVGNLVKLVELNLSKNSIEEIPESLGSCRSLAIVDFSMNPLMRPPEVLGSIPTLTHLMLNDVALARLPMDIGNLQNLVVLEARENLLKALPIAIGELRRLRRLDCGSNEIEELPPHIGQLEMLEELWLDVNSLSLLPAEITQLSNLHILDVTKNRITSLPANMDRMKSLKDLIVSENFLESVPPSIGSMAHLYQLKLDMNRIFELPNCFEGCIRLEELFLFDNLLENLPSSIFKMPLLRLLNVDRNHLVELPSLLGGAKNLHVLSLRDNELTVLPNDVGRLSALTVLDVCGNRLTHLPVSVRQLHLDALWLLDNQPQPLMQLHEEEGEVDNAKGPPKLVCSLLPQKGPYTISMENFLSTSDDLSNTREEKQDRSKGLSVAFDPSAGAPDDTLGGKLVRFPTPRRKGRNRDSGSKKHKPNLKGDAPSAPSIFKKTKLEDSNSSLTNQTSVKSVESNTLEELTIKQDIRVGDLSDVIENMRQSPSLVPNGDTEEAEATKLPDIVPHVEEPATDTELLVSDSVERPSSRVSFASDTPENEGKRAQMQRKDTPRMALNSSAAARHQETATATVRPTGVPSDGEQPAPNTSSLQTVVVEVQLMKEHGRSLGFSIAGGKGSMPAYEDVDDSVFITKIAVGGLAEVDGKLRLGDRLLSVNNVDMFGISHVEAVESLKAITDRCHLCVSREVLIVLPEGATSPPLEPSTDPSTTALPPPDSPPPEVQVDNASPPPGGQVDNASPPPGGQDVIVQQTGLLSDSLEELRAFGVHLSTTAGANEVAIEEVCVEQLATEENSAPDLLLPATVGGSERESEEEDAEAVMANLLQFGIQLTDRIEQSERAILSVMDANPQPVDGDEQEVIPPRDSYVNYDIAQAVIASPSNNSIATSDDDEAFKWAGTRSGDSPVVDVTTTTIMVGSGDPVEKQDTPAVPSVVDHTIAVATDKACEEKLDFVEEEVALAEGKGPLGMSIVGGSDQSSFPFGRGQSGVYISKVAAVGKAKVSNKLSVGDLIIQVNDWNTVGHTHQEVVNALITAATSGQSTTLLVRHDPPPSGLAEVHMVKGPTEKLGISIRGGENVVVNHHGNQGDSEDEGISVKGHNGNPFDAEDSGIFISKIISGGVAAKEERLRVGQRILEVNGTSLIGASHVSAVRLLSSVQEELALVVCDGFDPSQDDDQMDSTGSLHMIRSSTHASTSGGNYHMDQPVSSASPVDLMVTEEKLDEMLKELDDINKSIASPSSSSSSSSSSSEDEADNGNNVVATDSVQLLSSTRRSTTTPESNLVTTAAISTGDLDPEASEALRSIHNEMDQLQKQVDKEAEAMLQSTRKRRDSCNSDYQWAENEKKRLEQKAQELMERTRATQEATRKKTEDNKKKVREETEKLAQERKEEHNKRVQDAAKRKAQQQIQESPAEHKESLASMITEIFDQGALQSDFDQFNETSDTEPEVTVVVSSDKDEISDLVKGLTELSVDPESVTDETSSTSPNPPTLDQDVVTISYSQQSPLTVSPDPEEQKQAKQASTSDGDKKTSVTTVTTKSKRYSDSNIPNISTTSEKPPLLGITKRNNRKGSKGGNPERLSFVERLQLHEKAVEQESKAAKRLQLGRSSSATAINRDANSLQQLQHQQLQHQQHALAASSSIIDGTAGDRHLIARREITAKALTGRTTPKESSSDKQVSTNKPPVARKSVTITSRRSPDAVVTQQAAMTTTTSAGKKKMSLPTLPTPEFKEPSDASNHNDQEDGDDREESLEGLTPAQAKVLMAQQRRMGQIGTATHQMSPERNQPAKQ